MHSFTLVVNAGRSGSTYLSQLLQSAVQSNEHQQVYIAHEDIPVQISQPRIHNRAYDKQRYQCTLSDYNLKPFLEKWQSLLNTTSIIETGWTAYHLMPILHQLFGERFRYVILHRHPMSVALSRAAMGNYHPQTYYDNAHEVSPFDDFSVAPQYQSCWKSMNHFEKCLYWWYVIYLEADEFRNQYPSTPCYEISALDLFNGKAILPLFNFLGLGSPSRQPHNLQRNSLPRFMQESFPIEEEWRSYSKHLEIIEFAQNLGYCFHEAHHELEAKKYQRPRGLLPSLRQKTKYWRRRVWIKQKFGL